MSDIKEKVPTGESPTLSLLAASNVVNAVEAPVGLTESAARQVRIVQERDSRVDSYLRMSVVGGGCSGLSYKLSFEDQAGAKDKIFEIHGVKILLDPKSSLFLKGTVLDFSDGLNGQGFEFKNPNAKSSCGCGSSFSA